MREAYPPDSPTYEELEYRCIWLKGSLREARRSCQKARAWRAILLAVTVISLTLLVLTWSGYITI